MVTRTLVIVTLYIHCVSCKLLRYTMEKVQSAIIIIIIIIIIHLLLNFKSV